MTDGIIETRPALAQDENFIYSTWLQGYFHGNSITTLSGVSERDYTTNYRKIIKGILSREHTYTILVCLKEDHDVIISYAVLERVDGNTILHWAFTKPAFRRFGIIKNILPNDIVAVTHLTTMGSNIKPTQWVYSPLK